MLGSNSGPHCLRNNEVLRRPAESAEPPDGGRASLPQLLPSAVPARSIRASALVPARLLQAADLLPENTRISTLPTRKCLRFPCSASSANEKRSKRSTNAPKITFPWGDRAAPLQQGLRSASQPAERRVPPLILHRAPLRVRARAYEAGSGATDPSGVSTDAS